MALIYCPECKNQMSDTSNVCPKCGFPYGERLKIYQKAYQLMNEDHSIHEYLGIAEMFHYVAGIADAEECEAACVRKVEELQRRAEEIQREKDEAGALKRELERQEAERKEIKKKKSRPFKIIAGIVLVVAMVAIYINATKPGFSSVNAMKQAAQGEYEYATYTTTVTDESIPIVYIWRIKGDTLLTSYCYPVYPWQGELGGYSDKIVVWNIEEGYFQSELQKAHGIKIFLTEDGNLDNQGRIYIKQ